MLARGSANAQTNVRLRRFKETDMKEEDLEPRKKPGLALSSQDLSIMSIEELEERIAEMTMEIERCREMIAVKKGSRADAESVFKK
jgi:uncharacterized small protein (DUF1192 family)